jgi:hypothetical protein
MKELGEMDRELEKQVESLASIEKSEIVVRSFYLCQRTTTCHHYLSQPISIYWVFLF